MTTDDIRFALAGQAFASGKVRLVERSLAGCTHWVATRGGLFAVSEALRRQVAHGLFFGITVWDDAIFVFESCDSPASPSRRGRIVRLTRAGDEIVAAHVFAADLDNGCHQIDIVDGRLCVLDTYNQCVIRYPLGGGDPDVVRPIAGATASGWNEGYVHFNSLVQRGEDILLMLHNGARRTDRPSEIARLDLDWRLVERVPIDGLGCHNLAVLEDGAILCCGSFAGEIVSDRGLKIRVCDMMTRGLSVGDERIVVGGSTFGDCRSRETANSALFFLDRSFTPVARLGMPGPTMDIRRIDGKDRSLSLHLARSAPAGL